MYVLKSGRLKDRKLNILYLNARSIKNNFKMEEIGSYVKEYNVDIIGVTETWLNEQVGNSEIALDDFTVYRKDGGEVKRGRTGEFYSMSNII